MEEDLKQLRFEVGDSDVYVRLIEGEYPPYEKIIPHQFETTVSVDGETFLQELKRASIVAREASEVIQILTEEDNGSEGGGDKISRNLTIKATSASTGSYKGTCPLIQETGNTFEIAFKASYLIEFVKSCEPEVVEIQVNDSLKPAMFRIQGVKGFLYVVMPFRLNQ